jgi:hypothetical protein
MLLNRYTGKTLVYYSMIKASNPTFGTVRVPPSQEERQQQKVYVHNNSDTSQ